MVNLNVCVCVCACECLSTLGTFHFHRPNKLSILGRLIKSLRMCATIFVLCYWSSEATDSFINTHPWMIQQINTSDTSHTHCRIYPIEHKIHILKNKPMQI